VIARHNDTNKNRNDPSSVVVALKVPAAIKTTPIVRLRHAAAAPLHRTFPIIIEETNGYFSVHSENNVRCGLCVLKIWMHSWISKDSRTNIALWKAAANADFLAPAMDSAPRAGGFLKAPLFENRGRITSRNCVSISYPDPIA
jgi:hypothetical protein